MPSWTHTIESLGTVEFKTVARARHLRLKVRGSQISVTLPQGFCPDEALTWVSQHGPWVREKLASQRELRQRQQQAGLLLEPVADHAAAHAFLSARLAELAERHGLSYGQVTVRAQKTRWGSCSANGNISLNCRLIKLPAELRDYVILHELTHTLHHHHGPAFWTELARFCEDPRGLSRRLRRYQLI